MSCTAFVCLTVCLSVRLLATSLKIFTDRILTKILPKTYLCTRKILLNFGIDPLVDHGIRKLHELQLHRTIACSALELFIADVVTVRPTINK